MKLSGMKASGILALLGIALSFIFAIPGFNAGTWGPIVLVLIGLVIGFTTITVKERQKLLLVALVLGVFSAAIAFAPFGSVASIIAGFFSNLFALIAPMALIVGVLEFWDLAHKK